MKEIESKLQFVITIYLFIPVIFDAFPDPSSVKKNILGWAVFVAFLIADYLLIDYLKNKLSEKEQHLIRIILNVNIALFIPFILSISLISKSTFEIFFSNILAIVGILGIFLPLVLFIILMGYIGRRN